MSNIKQNARRRTCLTAPRSSSGHRQHLNRDISFPKLPALARPVPLLALARVRQPPASASATGLVSKHTTDFSFLFKLGFNTVLAAVPEQSHPQPRRAREIKPGDFPGYKETHGSVSGRTSD